MTKVKYEGEVKRCKDCPFCYYAIGGGMGDPSGYICNYRETVLKEIYAFVKEDTVDAKCPFKEVK